MSVTAGAAELFRQIVAAASSLAVLPGALWMAPLVLAMVRTPEICFPARARVWLFPPDGVMFTVPLLAGLLWQARGRHAGWVVALSLVPGIACFEWHWHCFGELLPLPFLVKSDFHRDLGVWAG
ncbi:hypothetical protein [Acidipila sp. EB88]|uniref:hypothetical protein n=1 Tax=Acidipila sp. EB88 TaxID=2305226 RepID=UPI000F5F16EC|nr:hypothetical protein [Acidipila sp. EB88]